MKQKLFHNQCLRKAYLLEATTESDGMIENDFVLLSLAVKSQTLHSKLSFFLGDVPFGVWPGPFLFIFGVWSHYSYFGVW